MEVKSITKNAKISPTKIRIIINAIRGKNAEHALEYLKYLDKKAAKIAFKTLFSAITSAKNKDMDLGKTIIKITKVDSGQASQRQIRKSRGSAQPIKKRSSHITIILSDEKHEILNTKHETNSKS